ncbi:MAG: peptide chain release factor N(5)-glutamine methyltransferase [Pseudomonadota bacterium]|nr:peptide chain release factor N(5)-glutamine methyltransferase [Pseudomonadota bacterium]
MNSDFDKMVVDARTVFDASASKPLREAWAGLDLVEVRAELVKRLREAGIDEADTDARFLLAHILAPANYAEAVADPALCSWQQISALAELAWERVHRKPMSQILGTQPFWTLELDVSEEVLTPRADTEALVEAVLEARSEEKARVLDIGVGSGAILLALLSERKAWHGVGVDVSETALEVAMRNARRCGLDDRTELLRASWGRGLPAQTFDILVSNPPYIRSDVMPTLDPEVRDYEPHLALDGGADGLDSYRAILDEARSLVKPGGLVAFEIGFDQGEAVRGLLEAHGLGAIAVIRDLAGHDRVVLGALS